jgi:transketolase
MPTGINLNKEYAHMDKTLMRELMLFANDIRRETIIEITTLGVGHIGGSMSVAEVLAVLYGKAMCYDPQNPQWLQRDHFVMSKGHAGPAVYATLALKGFFPMEWLTTLNQPGTYLPSHCDRLKTPGIDATTGSLGQGLSVAIGIAIAKKMDGNNSRVYTILGDGECNEGQIWEAALLAGHRGLDNLTAFVDYNHQMIDGRTEEVCNLGELHRKFDEFGWYAQEIDGHNIAQIDKSIQNAIERKGKPGMIVMHTIKGQGLSKYAGHPNNHNNNITGQEMEFCLAELAQQRQSIIRGVVRDEI